MDEQYLWNEAFSQSRSRTPGPSHLSGEHASDSFPRSFRVSHTLSPTRKGICSNIAKATLLCRQRRRVGIASGTSKLLFLARFRWCPVWGEHRQGLCSPTQSGHGRQFWRNYRPRVHKFRLTSCEGNLIGTPRKISVARQWLHTCLTFSITRGPNRICR